MIIHSREAAADTMDLLKANYHGEMPMVMHCYSYSPEMEREYRKMGLYLGIEMCIRDRTLQSSVEIYTGKHCECPWKTVGWPEPSGSKP